MSLADAMRDPDLFEEQDFNAGSTHVKPEPKLENSRRDEEMDDLFGDDEDEEPQRQRYEYPRFEGRNCSAYLLCV